MKHNDLVKYRPDIDGLRAVAVLSVVIFHAFPSVVTGGFVGVDVFFVISGYLISSILFKNLEKGTFSFFDFYSRRIRRIFPALLTVLIFCLVSGYFVLMGEEYKQLGEHTHAGSFFFSNIKLLDELSDYFDNAAELKPLLHLWSLGIEEQFYIAWPLVLFIAWRFRFNLFSITFLFALLSLTWNLADYKNNPIYTFYLPYSRIWELLFGAILAWFQTFNGNSIAELLPSYFKKFKFLNRPISIPILNDRKMRDFLSISGLILIFCAVFLYNKDTAYPGYAAILPVTGAFLLIFSGPDGLINSKFLRWKPLVFVGLISFPLYLWHWPLLSFASILESGTPELVWRLVAVLFSLIFSILTWHFIEKKIRFRENKSVIFALVGLLIFVGLLGRNIYKRNGWEWRIREYKHNAKIFEGWNTAEDGCVQRFQSEYGKNFPHCLVGDASKDPDVVLIGDSHANALAYGLIRKFESQGYNLLNMSKGGCPPFFGVEDNPKHPCEGPNHVLELLERNPKITKLILASRGPRYLTGKGYGEIEAKSSGSLKYKSRPDITDPQQAFQQAMYDTIKRLTAAKKEIVYIVDIPEIGFDPKRCVRLRPFQLKYSDVDQECRINRTDFDKRNIEYHKIISSIQRDFPSVKIWEAWKYLCDDKFCYAKVDGKLLYRDSNHLSLDGSYWLGEKYDPK
ncbi:acyltransferase family protein [Leptospira licerasiae]|uniref:Acyltransferase n=1 Tax=Leptospira licerasiae str. MMD4847 TaxID=1049971 RepID=A0ABN0H6I5_9LEPT|nr:acyltransferase family protein [Leptospira licerasiae]EIE03028.1 acyltransferase [Leptospira licerasiae serovar Varillal str. VAR 010]EJZ41178.1 acyltransferase [Leptospira licerasiae str. MMD4847]